MSKFLVIPDSFKGGITSQNFSEIAKKTIMDFDKNSIVDTFPISDGGDGSLESLTQIFNSKILQAKVSDSNFFKQNAFYGVGDDFAIVEVSSSASLAKCLIKDPMVTTTYGVGEQIKVALSLNKKKIYLCLGGSSTNDAGAGILSALGAKFYDKNNKTFIPTGGTLKNIVHIDLEEFRKITKGVEMIALCDVKNPLLGENGCSYIYAKQKGATVEDIEVLEENMKHFAKITEFLGSDPQAEGNGAAGGIGYMVSAFFKGKMISGIDFVLDKIDFEKISKQYDYIITGEGQFDNTSVMGKVVGGILKRNTNKNAKIVVFCGKSNFTGKIQDKGIYSLNELNDKNQTLEYNIKNTDKNLAILLRKFMEEEFKG